MTTAILEELHTVLAQELLRRIQGGGESPALLNVARQFLRDNGIESLPVADSALSELVKSMPLLEEEEGWTSERTFTH